MTCRPTASAPALPPCLAPLKGQFYPKEENGGREKQDARNQCSAGIQEVGEGVR